MRGAGRIIYLFVNQELYYSNQQISAKAPNVYELYYTHGTLPKNIHSTYS